MGSFRVMAVLATTAMTLSAAVTVEKTEYKGWPNCYRVSNGEVDLIVTTDVGPRVIRFGFVGGQNLFKEFPAQLGKTGEREWMARGGHRIWFAPEDSQLTYALDNAPVRAEVLPEGIRLIQPVEPETGLEKTIVVQLAATGTEVSVSHLLTNRGAKPWAFAPWALTMMATGGHGITGFPPRGKHPEVLAPTNPLVMWAFSDLSDPRWKFLKKYLVLRQDVKATGQPTKLGLFNPHTWGAYLLGSDLFVKRYAATAGKAYPDYNCSYETFTNAEVLELETLGPVETVAVGDTLRHEERWSLHKNVKVGEWTDAELDRVIAPLIK